MDRCKRQIRSKNGTFTAREDNGKLFIEGYFAVFNSPYEIWPGATEIVKPGAFANTLNRDIKALTNHDPTLVLGRNTALTLELYEDQKGLYGKIEINPNDTDALNLYARVQRGDVDQCSFGFDIVRETFIDISDIEVRWEIEEVILYEVSVVTFPAYEETVVVARKSDFKEIEHRKKEAWQQNMKARLKNGISSIDEEKVPK